MLRPRALAALCGVLLSFLFAGRAFAQDYTISYQTRATLYEAPPTSGTSQLAIAQGVGVFVNLPFDFPYFGVAYSNVWVSPYAFVQFGADSAGGSVEYTNTTWPPSGNDQFGVRLDGMVACLWDDINPDTTFAGGSGRVVHWTAGTAPNRRWIVSWEGVPKYVPASSNSVGSVTCQIRLHETTGRIEFGYKADTNPSTWQQLNYSAGLLAVKGNINDTRSFAGGVTTNFFDQNPTASSSNTLSGHPPRDVRFDPKSYTYAGTLQYDRLVSDGNGIGSSIQTAQPLAGLEVELRRTDGSLGFRTTTDATGAFSIRGVGANSTQTGSLVVTATSAACVVRAASDGPAAAYTFRTNVPQNANQTYGTIRIDSAADASGAVRAPLHVARVIQAANDWVRARTTESVPLLEVLHDTASSAATAYTYASASAGTPPSLRIASAGAANPDSWDNYVITREYGRHVLASVAGTIGTTSDSRLDLLTDEQNAFAAAFGTWLHAAITRQTTYHDGLTATTAASFNPESPVLTVVPGPDVAGAVAAALFDLVDPANEAWDPVDGTGAAADTVLHVAATMTPPVTTSRFYAAWGAAGNHGFPLSRIWVHERLVADDTDESNDGASEATNCGGVGFRRAARVLNVYAEDWYEFTLPSASTSLVTDLTYDRSAHDTGVTFQVYDSIGTLRATGAPQGQFGSIRATVAAPPAGTWRLRVRHDSGVRLPTYAVQAFLPQSVTSDPFVPWTVGRPYSVQIRPVGGVPPHRISIDSPYARPAGITLDSTLLRFTGTPLAAGTTYLVVTTTDSGDPANATPLGVQFIVNPEFDVALGQFMPFALGKAHTRPVPTAGGTQPFTFALGSGTLPTGIVLNPATRLFEGTPTIAEATTFRVNGTDVAGSTDGNDTTGVVCIPFGAKPVTADLSAGPATAGFFFDAVDSSTVAISLTTAKKQAKRTLAVVVTDADGVPVPATVKAALGRAAVSKVLVPRSGRYYCIVSSADGDATQIVGSVRVGAPTRAAGRLEDLVAGSPQRIEFGALAGAKLTFRTAPDRESGAKVGIFSLLGPDDQPVEISAVGKLTSTKTGGVLTATLPASGTWKVVVGALPGAEPNVVTYSVALKQTKAPYDADLAR